MRRHLGISVEEWDRTPWTTQQIYVDGLMEEFGAEEEQGDDTGKTQVFDLDEDPDAMAMFGVVRQVV